MSIRPELVAVTKEKPETIADLVDWIMKASEFRNNVPTGEEIAFLDSAYFDHLARIAEAQGVPTGWLANGVMVLATERLRTGKQMEFDLG